MDNKENNNSNQKESVFYNKSILPDCLYARYRNELSKTDRIMQEDPDADLFTSGMIVVSDRINIDEINCSYAIHHSAFGNVEDMIKILGIIIIEKMKMLKGTNIFGEYMDFFLETAIHEGVWSRPEPAEDD